MNQSDTLWKLNVLRGGDGFRFKFTGFSGSEVTRYCIEYISNHFSNKSKEYELNIKHI